MNIAEIQLTLNNNQKIKRIRKIESVRSGGFQENNRTYSEVWWIPGEQQNIQ